MNKIHAAYQKLGAHPGTEFDVIKRRYKLLVMVWHPDRLTTPEGKKVAEEEIKSINNAFDCLKKHFESGHRQGPACECQPAVAQNQQTGARHNQNASSGHSADNGYTGSSQRYSNPSGFQQEKTAYEKWAEQEARAQESERRRSAEEAAHEAALREALEKARQVAEAHAAAAASATAKAQSAATPMIEEQFRWCISLVLGAIFLFLLIGGFNKRYEPSSKANSEFSLSEKVEHLRPCPF